MRGVKLGEKVVGIITLELIKLVVKGQAGDDGAVLPQVKLHTVFEYDPDEAAIVVVILYRALNDADLFEELEFEFVSHRVIDKVLQVNRPIPVVLAAVVFWQPLVVPELDFSIVRIKQRDVRAKPPEFIEYFHG